MNLVNICFALAPTLDGYQPRLFQFSDQLGDARPGQAHVIRQPVLPRKARIIMPGVAQEHGVGDFGTHRQACIFQNEIRDLGEAPLQHGIDRVQL